MENFSKNTLKSAVKKFGQRHTDGKAESEVKAEIAKDDRKFTDDQINLIYKEIVDPTLEEESKSKTYKVVEGKSFRDKDDFSKEYTSSSDITHLGQERIDHLVAIGYVEEA